MGFFEKIAEGIRKTRDSVMGRLTSLFNSFTKIDEEFFESLEETLIMCDIGAETSIEICDALRKKVKEKGLTDPSEITTELSSIIEEMLGEDKKIELDTKPVIILVIGVNGAGKTTTIGKLASKYIADGKKVIVAAADTFRAAAIEQLEVWCDRAGAEIVKHSEGSDPASVVFDAIQAAKARGADVLICDTAGRLHNKKNLMEELKKINRICQGQAEGCRVETLLVLDATTGQNAVNQAKMFSEVADVSGIVLTKLDGTAKGGIIISIHKELGIPVKLVGVGEKIDDLMEFSAHDFAQALFVSNTNFEGNYERLDEDPEKDEDIGETALKEDTAREQGEEELVRDTVETEEIPLDDGDEPVEEELEEEPVTDTEPDEESTDEEQPAEETAVQKKSLKDGRFGFLFKEITFGKKKEKTEETSQEDMQ
ncbi:MAG: signal recognition particle-docking protein FtsY [Oscillospiraceae bacterium]|nr:signal recognition particle-docking protein FtsY [Oscillospiraceae bacterium]